MACASGSGCCGHDHGGHEEQTHDDDVQQSSSHGGSCCQGATKNGDSLKPAETT